MRAERLRLDVALGTVALVLAFLDVSSGAQTSPTVTGEAEVTFYSNGSFWKGSLPGNQHGMFNGRIMDEFDQLAMLSPGRFITFRLDAGPHTFSANSWLVPRPEGGGHLDLDLVAGKHYYIGAYLEQLVVWAQPRLELRSCEQAKADSEKTERLEEKHLKKYGKVKVVAETAFPVCS